MKGYHVVEPAAVDKIITSRVSMEFQLFVLRWVISTLRENIIQDGLPIKVDLIKVEYTSTYPAIGIHYSDVPSDEFADYCEKYVTEKSKYIIENCPFIEFVINNHESFQSEHNQW